MAMTTCRECRGAVSDQAGACPHCGVQRPADAAGAAMSATNKAAVKVVALLAGAALLVVLYVVLMEYVVNSQVD